MRRAALLKKRGVYAVLTVIFLFCAFWMDNRDSSAENGNQVVVRIPVDGTIDKALPFYIKRGIIKADEINADIIVIDINTLGGDAQAAILIRDALVRADIKTYAWINRAISAGALIALSCDEMWMETGGIIGAAQPYMMGPGGVGGDSEDTGGVPKGKLISYLSGEFSATARKKGHNEDIARAFVDPDYGLKDVQKKGQPLTLGDEKAMDLNFISGTADKFEEFLENIGYGSAEVKMSKLDVAEKVARFISNPMYSWIFLLIGILGLIIEFKTPGFGGGGLVGGIALVLFFWGNHIAQLANWVEIILFVIGICLVLLEIFVIPGFGVAGISGGACILLAIFLAMFKLPPMGFEFDLWRLVEPLASLAVGLFTGSVAFVLAIKYLPETRLWKRLALQTEQLSTDGFVAPPDLHHLLGKIAETETVLRPSGSVRIDGIRYDATTQCGYIPNRTKVRVIGTLSASLLVEVPEDETPPNPEG